MKDQICRWALTLNAQASAADRKKRREELSWRGLQPCCIAAGDSPLSTWTLTVAGSALSGRQMYFPESAGRAFWISRELLDSTPFSVTTLTPPRFESYPIIWLLCCQRIEFGGSGLSRMTQVRLMVLPIPTKTSLPPRTVVLGSTTRRWTKRLRWGVVDIWHS